MTWKPKSEFTATNEGNCPNCGEKIPLAAFLDMTLEVKGEEDPVDVSEPNFHCENCGTDLVVDATIQFVVRAQLFKKQDLTSEAE